MTAGQAIDAWRTAAGFDFSLATEGVRYLIADATSPTGRTLKAFGGKRVIYRTDSATPMAVVSTSCDGSLATEIRATSTRVVCNNTLSMAIGDPRLYRSTHRSTFDRDAAPEIVRKAAERRDAFRKITARMTGTALPRDLRDAFVTSVLDPKAVDLATGKVDGKAVDAVRESTAWRTLMGLFVTGRGAMLETARGTVWGALNAITEYVDHERRAHSVENRFVSAQWGPGAAMKDRALELAVRLAQPAATV